MSPFPQPGLERRWKSLPGQPVGDAGDPYTGYDRFGRTEAMLWGRPQEGGGFEKLVEVRWGYDRASLKTWRKDLLAPASAGQDQHFGYDGLYQVSQRQRGLLNTNASAIGGIPAQQEGFGYDETGNWVSYRRANTGELDIDQSRVNNRSNQITQVDGSSSGLSYDRNGNLLTVPSGEGLTGPSRKLVWDAWNRLVEVRDAEDAPTASYQYDAATRRTVSTTGTEAEPLTRQFYYDDQWRSVQEQPHQSSDPERQFVWHPANRWELLLRDRTGSGSGPMDERLYPMKDQLDPVALCDATGTVVERYAYSAFGMTSFLNPDFTPREGDASPYLWNFLFHAEFADPETGWFNYGYRYYLPEMGRWPSRDPIGERGGVNLYTTLKNNLVGKLEYLGLADQTICMARPSTIAFSGGGWKLVSVSSESSLSQWYLTFDFEATATWEAEISVECVCWCYTGNNGPPGSKWTKTATGKRVFTSTFDVNAVRPDPMAGGPMLPLPGGGNLGQNASTAAGAAGGNGLQNIVPTAQTQMVDAAGKNAPKSPREGSWKGGDPCKE